MIVWTFVSILPEIKTSWPWKNTMFFWIVSCRGGLVFEFISNCLSNNLFSSLHIYIFSYPYVPFLVLVWLSLSQKTEKKWGLLLHLFLSPLSLQNPCTKVIIWRSRL